VLALTPSMPPPPPTHTHTHTRARTHTLTHTRTRTTGYSEDRFYIHCDGALFGMMMPFIKEVRGWQWGACSCAALWWGAVGHWLS
jgi:hypothetical protein